MAERQEEQVLGFRESEWNLLLMRIRDEECVPFLGAGASMGFDGEVGLPTAGELAKDLARECAFPGTDGSDFFRVTQYYEFWSDPYNLRKAIQRRLRVRNLRPGRLHKALAQLPFRYIMTTNFDNLMERALEEEGKNPESAVYDIKGNVDEPPMPTVNAPLVYKLHGSIEDPLSMVCTEDDVIQFLSCLMQGVPPLPRSIKQIFESHSVLFIGYGLKDWNIRVMLRAIRGAKRSVKSFAIQRRPDDPGLRAEWDQSLMYWSKKEEVYCFDVDALDFVEELLRRYKNL